MPRVSATIRAILITIAAAAIALSSLVVLHPPHIPVRVAAKVKRPQRVAPATIIPDVEPVEIQDLAPEDAKAFNASIPFVNGPNPAARAFRFAGSTDDLARATDCLAAAVYYEAGDDSVGERAVAQVVLNRLRHPAFPKTVCGVVFQGSERSTGCQFTFTCDGALARTPSDAAWRRARQIATAALTGSVYRPVGYATHYHTDWVVPYWQSSLDKLAEVHTHLFFRWTGWWGTPPAFNRHPSGIEPAIAKLASLSPEHRNGVALGEADAAIIEATPYTGGTPLPLASEPGTFLTNLPTTRAGEFPALAKRACGELVQCKMLGWTDLRQKAAALPMTPDQMNAMSFSYLRDRATGLERMLWNCAEFQRPPAQCMKRQVLRLPPVSVPPPAGAVIPPPVVPTRGALDLTGVRRKPAGPPAPLATPTPQPTAITQP
jgi:spore germination cell wall hydrolase CwlJ-like protein